MQFRFAAGGGGDVMALMLSKRNPLEGILCQMLGSESGEKKELLKKKFYGQLAKVKKDSSRSKYLLECMVKAAEDDDEEVFEWLLDLADGKRIPVELNRKYIDKIVERFGIGNNTWDALNVTMGCKIPGIYAAIIDGDVELVRYYLKHGASLKPDHTEEFLLYGGSEGIVSAISVNEDYPAFQGNPFGPFGGIGGDNTRGYMLCHDPFTAAIFSGSIEMIQYIGDTLEDIFWNDGMEKGFAYSTEEIQDYLLENYPEITDYLSLSVILETKNRKLLDMVVKKRGEDNLMWEDFCCSLKKATGREMFYRFKSEPGNQLVWESPPGKREEKLFLKKMFDYIPTDEIRIELQNFVLMEGILSEDEQRAGMLLNIFFKAGDVETKDHTEIMCRICESEAIHWDRFEKLARAGRIGIDLYADDAEALGAILRNHKMMGRFLGAVRPLRIRNEPDVYTQYIVDTNQIMSIKKAIKGGFITPRNALAVYEYAAEGKRFNEYVLDALVRLAQKENTKERYVEEM